MYCKHCGEPMSEHQAVCLKCGVAKGNGNAFCPNCGNAVNAEASFCQVTFLFMWEPAKYSAPGIPNFSGEHVNVCHTRRFAPSAYAISASGLRKAGSTE